MGFQVVQSESVQALWDTCSDRFLDELGDNIGPGGFDSYLWITHRNLRDLLFERAFGRGLPGWLGPPVAFFSGLPELFDVRLKPIGPIRRRALVRQLAVEHGRRIFDRDPGKAADMVRGHMLDNLFNDLLPEGVHPERLQSLLATFAADRFAHQRNEWIVQVYAGYLDNLEELGMYDVRSRHALIAERIEGGHLPSALNGATRLHIYGIYTLGTRERMFRALQAQQDIDVVAYVAKEPEDSELAELSNDIELVANDAVIAASPVVQPAPSAVQELTWVAREIKEILAEGKVEAHEITVVARSGHADTRQAYRLLTKAGVHCTARTQTPLAEIPAIKALLSILQAASSNWSYVQFRTVLDHPYLNIPLDLKCIDDVASNGRVKGLDKWEEGLNTLAVRVRETRKEHELPGLSAVAVAECLAELSKFRTKIENLEASHTEAEWAKITLRLMEPGVFDFWQRILTPVDNRWDIVRLDQQGVMKFETLLKEWAGLDHSARRINVSSWHARLQKVLEPEELELSTPSQKGVQVQSAKDAALVPFRYTFIIHANDGEFPRHPGADGIFLDEERRALRKLGLPFSHREEQLRRERSLWRSVALGRETRVSYRTTDAEGRPLLPSLMVPFHDPKEQISRNSFSKDQNGNYPIPLNSTQVNELTALEFAEAIQGKALDKLPKMTSADPPLLDQAIVAAVAERRRGIGMEVTSSRHPAIRPNPWNGAVRDPVVLERLARMFGDNYLWSAGQLELYSTCPFAFFVKRVLRLEGTAEADEQLSGTVRGSIAHDLLEQFYRETKENLPSFLTGKTLQVFDSIAEHLLAEREASGEWLGLPSLWPTARRSVCEGVRSYLAWEIEYLDRKAETPELIEHEFGFRDPVIIRGRSIKGTRVDLRLCGRIDRVDSYSDGNQARHHVLDYKLGRIPTKSGYTDGSVLQGPLYLRVLEELGLAVDKCRYRSIGSPGKPQNGAEIRAGSDQFEEALLIAFSVPERVRSGLFEASLAANAGGWPPYFPGREICRSQAQLKRGSRFDV